MWHRARREPPVAREGDLIVDGRVRARLLGLQLLDIDAHVVVTPARPGLVGRARPVGTGERPVPSPIRPGGNRHRPGPGRGRPRATRTGPTPPGLARAEDLIAEGTNLLDEATRIH
jgi:hypothetical protein